MIYIYIYILGCVITIYYTLSVLHIKITIHVSLWQKNIRVSYSPDFWQMQLSPKLLWDDGEDIPPGEHCCFVEFTRWSEPIWDWCATACRQKILMRRRGIPRCRGACAKSPTTIRGGSCVCDNALGPDKQLTSFVIIVSSQGVDITAGVVKSIGCRTRPREKGENY